MQATDDGSYSNGSGLSSGCGAPRCPSTDAYPFGFNINFFGVQYAGAYINNDGNITFGNFLQTYTPFALAGTDTPIIAPFFADVNTSVGNTVNIGTGELNGDKVFVVNWPGVGCYNSGPGNTDETDDYS